MARTDDAPMSLRELVESPTTETMAFGKLSAAVEADEHNEEIAPGKIFASSSLHI